jgi:hypothetical protein
MPALSQTHGEHDSDLKLFSDARLRVKLTRVQDWRWMMKMMPDEKNNQTHYKKCLNHNKENKFQITLTILLQMNQSTEISNSQLGKVQKKMMMNTCWMNSSHCH